MTTQLRIDDRGVENPPRGTAASNRFAFLRSEKVPAPALLILVAIAVLMLFINPVFVSPANVAAILEQGSIPVVLAVGLTFVILMGGIDLSLAGVMAASSMTTALLVANDRNNIALGLLAVPIAVAVGGALGYLAGLAVSKLRVPSFIVTIGTWQIGIGIGLLMFAGKPPRVSDAGFRGIVNGDFLGLQGVVWIALVIALIGMFVQTRTRFGRYAYVIGGSDEIARLSGVNVPRYRTVAFVVSGAAAGMAGVLATARTGVGDVGAGGDLLFTTIAGIVIGGTLLTGGKGGVLHSIVGVIVIVVISNAMVLGGVSSYVQQAVQGAVVIIAASVALWRSRERLRVIK